MSKDAGLPEQIKDDSCPDAEPPRPEDDDYETVETSENTTLDVRLGGATASASIDPAPVYEPDTEDALQLHVHLGPASINSALTYEQAETLIEELQRALQTARYYRDADKDPYDRGGQLDDSHLPGGRDR